MRHPDCQFTAAECRITAGNATSTSLSYTMVVDGDGNDMVDVFTGSEPLRAMAWPGGARGCPYWPPLARNAWSRWCPPMR